MQFLEPDMQLPLEQRSEHAVAMRVLLADTIKCLCRDTPESEARAELLILWDGKFTPLEKAVETLLDAVTSVPAEYEFDSLDLYSMHYLFGLMLHVLRDNGVEPRGDYFQMNRSVFKLATMQEQLEIEFLEEMEEAEEDDDEDDEPDF